MSDEVIENEEIEGEEVEGEALEDDGLVDDFEEEEDDLDSELEAYLEQEDEEDEEDEEDDDALKDADEFYEEEEEEEEEEEGLDLISYDEEEEEEEEEVDLDDQEDSEIVSAAYLAEDFDAFFTLARENNITVDERFVANMAREGVDPNYMAEKGIFSFADWVNHADHLEETNNPDRIIIPDGDDPEEHAEFNERVFGIPREIEGYPEDLFDGTFLEESPEAVDKVLTYSKNEMLSREQARGFVGFLQEEKELHEEEMEHQERLYIREQGEQLDEIYGEGLDDQIKIVKRVLRNHGEEFAKEYGGDKVLKSASFFKMMSSMIDAGTKITDISIRDFTRTLQTVGTEKLEALLNKIANDPRYDDKHANSKGSSLKTYKRLGRQYNAIHAELEKRG